MVGQPGWEFVMGKKSGTFSVDNWLVKIGKDTDYLTKEQKLAVLDLVKELSFAEKRLITIEEFKRFIKKVV
jgi:hypothetical protein